jgi:hypothetical protein
VLRGAADGYLSRWQRVVADRREALLRLNLHSLVFSFIGRFCFCPPGLSGEQSDLGTGGQRACCVRCLLYGVMMAGAPGRRPP